MACVGISGDEITLQRSADVTRAVPGAGRGALANGTGERLPASSLPDVAVFWLSILAPTLISAVTSERSLQLCNCTSVDVTRPEQPRV